LAPLSWQLLMTALLRRALLKSTCATEGRQLGYEHMLQVRMATQAGKKVREFRSKRHNASERTDPSEVREEQMCPL
jgi:hypothetical protein